MNPEIIQGIILGVGGFLIFDFFSKRYDAWKFEQDTKKFETTLAKKIKEKLTQLEEDRSENNSALERVSNYLDYPLEEMEGEPYYKVINSIMDELEDDKENQKRENRLH